MRYVAARIEIDDRDEAYRIYVTDALRAWVGTKVRYYDVVHKEEDTRTSEDVKTGIFGKLKRMEDST